MPTGPHQWAVLIAAVVIAVFSPLLVKLAKALDDTEPFNKMRDVWLEKPLTSDPKACYVRGKMLPFGILGAGKGAGVDKELYKALPDELRPKNPEEVETIANVYWYIEPVTTPQVAYQFYYILGYQYVCEVTIIDRRARKKLATRKFRGSDPTKGFRDGNGYGDKPYAEILAYLTSLPRMRD